MWTRLLFALRSTSLDLGRWLGSWRLSVVLTVLAALYYVFLAIWSASSPPHVVGNIANLIPFWLVYALLLINTGVCFWRRLPRLRIDIGRAPALGSRAPEAEVQTSAGDPARARRLLHGLGYRVERGEEATLRGVRRRWTALGSYLFHGALFLVAAGFLLTLWTRQEAQVWVAVGEEFTGDPDQVLSLSPPRIFAAGAPAPPFRVAEIRPEFWRDELLFTTLEADVELAGGRLATTRINRPLWLGWGTFLRLSGFGYAPRYELRDAYGHTLDSSFVKLDLFPPGQRDYFSPPDYPHRIYLEVYPDFAVEDGEPTTRSLNLANPAVGVQVYRGRLGLGRAVLRQGNSLEFEGLTLLFPEIRYWGQFSIVSDPGAPLLFAAYLLGLAGLALKLRGPRAEVEWRPAAGGGLLRFWGTPPPELAGAEAALASRGEGSR